MAKESSHQIFPIDLFVKEVYHAMKILHEYNRNNNRLLIWSSFIISLKEKIIFEKFFEASFGSKILALFAECKCKSTDTFGFIRVQTFEVHP